MNTHVPASLLTAPRWQHAGPPLRAAQHGRAAGGLGAPHGGRLARKLGCLPREGPCEQGQATLHCPSWGLCVTDEHVEVSLSLKPDLITFLEQRKEPWNVKSEETVAIQPDMFSHDTQGLLRKKCIEASFQKLILDRYGSCGPQNLHLRKEWESKDLLYRKGLG
uniref:KRAB domain-containing protein n=1 Tax=Macaca fascicularis TaxID=9541 RepID=A0A2K5VU86_MACFA